MNGDIYCELLLLIVQVLAELFNPIMNDGSVLCVQAWCQCSSLTLHVNLTPGLLRLSSCLYKLFMIHS